jgi:hypothetical protein
MQMFFEAAQDPFPFQDVDGVLTRSGAELASLGLVIAQAANG